MIVGLDVSLSISLINEHEEELFRCRVIGILVDFHSSQFMPHLGHPVLFESYPLAVRRTYPAAARSSGVSEVCGYGSGQELNVANRSS